MMDPQRTGARQEGPEGTVQMGKVVQGEEGFRVVMGSPASPPRKLLGS